MVVYLKDVVINCYSYNDGQKVFNKIYPLLEQKRCVVVSFASIGAVSSSFINGAFLPLLTIFGEDYLKDHLDFIQGSRTTISLLKRILISAEIQKQEEEKK